MVLPVRRVRAEEIREFNFREGGSDRLRTRWNSGMISDFRNTYWEIIPDKRIVYAYEMFMNDKRPHVGVAGDDLVRAIGSGHEDDLTEQGAFLEPFAQGRG